MSVPFVVATIFVAGWNLTLMIVVLLVERGFFRADEQQKRRKMSRSLKRVQVVVGEPEMDARTEAWKREGGFRTVESFPSRVAETKQEVTLQAPYAEASVPVVEEGGKEFRRCSVCMN